MSNTVANVVRNRVYTGEARKGEWVKKGAHPTIVTESEWLAAQGRRPKQANGAAATHLLTGLLRCASCRYVMKGDHYDAYKRTGRIPFYRCRGKHSAGTCPQCATITASVIEPVLVKAFFDFLRRIDVEAFKAAPEYAQAEQELKVARAELVSFRDDLEVRSILGRDDYIAGLGARRQAVEAAEEKSRYARSKATGLSLNVPEFNKNVWLSLTVPERRTMLASVIDAVFVLPARDGLAVDDRLHICWKGEAPADLPRQGGRKVPLRSFIFPSDDEIGIGMPVAHNA